VQQAIKASADAWHDWRRTPWEERAAVLLRAAELLAGPWRTTLVVGAYELATIATMVVLVLPAREAAAHVRGPWAVRFGDATAGAVIASVGVLVAVLGW